MQNLTADWLIQGNHDRAVGLGQDPRSSVAYQPRASATQQISEQLLTVEMKQFLGGLQPLQRFKLNEASVWRVMPYLQKRFEIVFHINVLSLQE